jgi:hypothetical protein
MINNVVIALDINSQAWTFSAASGPWRAYPEAPTGLDMIAVGDLSNNGTNWNVFATSKTSPGVYYHRVFDDYSAPWTIGNQEFGDGLFDMNTFSFGGVSDKFIFATTDSGDYQVSQYPNAGWWLNWHSDMGPNKPVLTQLVSCNTVNYGLNGNGAIFTQNMWQSSGGSVNQWVSVQVCASL